MTLVSLIAMPLLLSWIGIGAALYVWVKCRAGLERNSLSRDKANLLWWFVLCTLMLWIAVFSLELCDLIPATA